MLYQYILVGILGGLVRTLYGIFKAVGKGKTINPSYFISSLIISGIIGGIIAPIFSTDIKIAALAGYAGTDLIEFLIKTLIPKTIQQWTQS